MRRALTQGVFAAAVVLTVGCGSSTGSILALMDATSDEDIDDAVQSATGHLTSGGLASRLAAAKTLGRLRRADPEAVKRLSQVLGSTKTKPELRAMCAWALGEMRSSASLNALVAGLRQSLDQTTGAYALEGISKHYALISRDEDRLVEIVDAMVVFAGNQKKQIAPIYEVLGERTRTVAVNIRVFAKELDALLEKASPQRQSAAYSAAFELFARLDAAEQEIVAEPSRWQTRIKESLSLGQRVFSARDPHLERMTLWMIGRSSDLKEVGGPAANALVGSEGTAKGRASLAASPGLRFLAAWSLSRMLLFGTGPRRAMLTDVLPKEIDPAVLELLTTMSRQPGDVDVVQKLVGAGGEG